MHFDGEIRKLKPVDVTTITQWALSQTPEQWNEITFRQRSFATHVHTESIFLVYNENGINVRNAIFLDTFEPILSGISNNVSVELGINNLQINRMIIVNLKPYGFIRRHVDTGTFLENNWRCHFPLKTNKNVLFHVGNSTINMLENSGYLINNQVPHGVSNNSTYGRYHLIVDFG